jgi:hypothetical protein
LRFSSRSFQLFSRFFCCQDRCGEVECGWICNLVPRLCQQAKIFDDVSAYHTVLTYIPDAHSKAGHSCNTYSHSFPCNTAVRKKAIPSLLRRGSLCECAGAESGVGIWIEWKRSCFATPGMDDAIGGSPRHPRPLCTMSSFLPSQQPHHSTLGKPTSKPGLANFFSLPSSSSTCYHHITSRTSNHHGFLSRSTQGHRHHCCVRLWRLQHHRQV